MCQLLRKAKGTDVQATALTIVYTFHSVIDQYNYSYVGILTQRYRHTHTYVYIEGR